MYTNAHESASRNHLLELSPIVVHHVRVHMVPQPPARALLVSASSAAVAHVCPTREQLTPRPMDDMTGRNGRAEQKRETNQITNKVGGHRVEFQSAQRRPAKIFIGISLFSHQ